jgi:hypothetical protein
MITKLRDKSIDEVRADIAGFSLRYASDWERWMNTAAQERPSIFVQTLGRWKATRPGRLRRLRVLAGEHPPPYIEDLLASSVQPLQILGNLSVGAFVIPTQAERDALTDLWTVFSGLRQVGTASCVAITKAVLLLSDGRIGPAFDSKVRDKLEIPRLLTAC